MLPATTFARDEALDIALGSDTGLQRALDAAKHGRAREERRTPITLLDVLHAAEPRRTVAIHHGLRETEVAFLWYSLCDVHLRHVLRRIDACEDEDACIVVLDPELLALHVLTLSDVQRGLERRRLDVEAIDAAKLKVYDPPCNVSMLPLREAPLPIVPGRFVLHRAGSIVYTVFRGELYRHIAPWCDECLSTSTEVNIAYMGKLNVARAYERHVSGESVDLYIALMLCGRTDTGAYDFQSIGFDDPLKALTIKDQVATLYAACVQRQTDALSSRESKLVVGASLSEGRYAEQRVHGPEEATLAPEAL